MKTVILGFFLIIFFSPSFAQKHDFNGPVGYAEMAGTGAGLVSVNIEHLVYGKSSWYVNARLGYGISRIQGLLMSSVPIGINIFYGNKNSHLEIGAAINYAEGRQYVVGVNVYSKALYFIPSLSYRFQKPNGGLFFRVGYTPLLKLKEYSEAFHDIRINQSFGISLGYFFFRERKI